MYTCDRECTEVRGRKRVILQTNIESIHWIVPFIMIIVSTYFKPVRKLSWTAYFEKLFRILKNEWRSFWPIFPLI